MCEKQLQPIVVLTKVDLIPEADLTNRLSDVFDSGVIDVYISEFCKSSTIPRENVFPVVNFRGPWSERDYVAEKLLLNSFVAALSFAQTKVATLVEKTVAVYDRSDPENLRKVAIIDRRSLDDSILFVAQQIAQEPGLEQFQIFLRGTSTLVPKNQYTQTKFMACASPSAYGFWELFGTLPTSSSSGNSSVNPWSAVPNKPTEIVIYTEDPRDPSSVSIGSVTLSPHTALSKLRTVIEDEVEVPGELVKFQFLHLGEGAKSLFVDEQEETILQIQHVMAQMKETCVRISKAQVCHYSHTCFYFLNFFVAFLFSVSAFVNRRLTFDSLV